MTEKLTDKVQEPEIAALVSALGCSPTAQQIVRRMAFELDRHRETLREIRDARNDEGPGAARMQQLAAWSLFPEILEKPK